MGSQVFFYYPYCKDNFHNFLIKLGNNVIKHTHSSCRPFESPRVGWTGYPQNWPHWTSYPPGRRSGFVGPRGRGHRNTPAYTQASHSAAWAFSRDRHKYSPGDSTPWCISSPCSVCLPCPTRRLRIDTGDRCSHSDNLQS